MMIGCLSVGRVDARPNRHRVIAVDLDTTIGGADGVRGIFDHGQVMTGGDGMDSFQVTGLATVARVA